MGSTVVQRLKTLKKMQLAFAWDCTTREGTSDGPMPPASLKYAFDLGADPQPDSLTAFATLQGVVARS